MLNTQAASSSPQPEAAQYLLSDSDSTNSDSTSPERHRVRHILYGSSRAIEHTIHQLHLLRYVDQFRWNPIADVPENNIPSTHPHSLTKTLQLREFLKSSEF